MAIFSERTPPQDVALPFRTGAPFASLRLKHTDIIRGWVSQVEGAAQYLRRPITEGHSRISQPGGQPQEQLDRMN